MPGKVKRSLLLDRGSDERFGARRQAAFSNINFSSLFYQRPILVAKGKTIDYACKRKRRYDGRARVILLCNIDMPTISYFPPCYVDQRGITGRIGDFPVNWFLSRLKSRSIEWIENIFNGFYYTYSYVGAKDWQKSLTRIFYWHFISD